MNSKHTQREWNAIQDSDGVWQVVSSSPEKVVDIADVWTNEDDAKLIAAAPKLLEACRAARSAIVLGNGRNIDWDAIADQLGNAIEKSAIV